MVRASIVIPAHNEAALIGPCLTRITFGAEPGEWEIVVVCNGCTDDTAARARAVAGVTVLETETPGKMPALDLGDATATAFPRLYVDADAVVDAAALRALADALADPGSPRVGSPRLHVDASSASWLVRAYFDVWGRLRYAREAIGTGVYGLSAAGRARFENFPERGGDDTLMYRLYPSEERVITEPSFSYVPPKTLRSLVRGRARMFALGWELERTTDLPPPEHIGWKEQGLEAVAKEHPTKLPKVVLFLVVQVTVKLWARQMAKADEIPWNQDRTTRETV